MQSINTVFSSKYDLSKIYLQRKNGDNSTYVNYSFDSCHECETFNIYGNILDCCKEHGYDTIYDIGCSYGWQSELCLHDRIKYIGIEMSGIHSIDGFWNSDIFEYINKKYPFEISATKTAVAVSVLCVGWNCFDFDGNNLKCIQALSRDFNQCILYIPESYVEICKQYFKNIYSISEIYENLYLLQT